MSFAIELMYNGDEYNKINKNPASRLTVQGTLKEETSIVDPVVLIEYDGTLNNVNYARISEFNRWYFITDISSVRTGLWRVAMHCDVLKTYSEAILGSSGVIARQENDFNLYLNDPSFKAYQYSNIVTKVFPYGFNSQAFVLAFSGQQEVSPNASLTVEGSVREVES